ncbi:glyoxalase [Yeosuana sp. MJ-SS3]|uniref:Glyoxalase n=1 Tax=Gilvirhabdus luticola TaxID=3079858 RepID=A0ABU3U9R8_9FLAO|nr:glyoxalase [Yeosuana sp. MJ-SS3]MDU8887097.1 glyoxalase [Yeosuana sp. MJ-SS3]
MDTRNTNLKSIRPEVSPSLINDNMSSDERFQNLVLRPITMLQGDLIIEVFRNYLAKHKSTFYNLTLEKRVAYIDNSINKDIKFRNSLKGMIIGLFTVEEYMLYIENSSALNKRMMHIVKEHLQNNIQLFERPKMLTAI